VPRAFFAAFGAFLAEVGISFPESLQILPGSDAEGAATDADWGIVAG